MKTAEIICVGTELLLGEVINTNAAYISKKLAECGISVYHQVVVGDNPERLKIALKEAYSRCDLVITSGGLGPTYDDLTKETVAEFFGMGMRTDENALDAIKEYFKTRAGGLESMPENNLKQALVPEGGYAVANPNGTAPAIIIEKDGKTAIMLPGPPRELFPLMDGAIGDFLKDHAESILVSHNMHVLGMGESEVEEVLKDVMLNSLNPTVAPYAGDGEMRLRITAKADNEALGERLCREMMKTINDSPVGKFVYGIDVGNTENAVILALRENKMTIATAESCTGGLISKRLTDISGASEVYLGGCVTYANEAKVKLLGVKEDTLKAHGAVSAETAIEMARGVREALGTDIGVSTTGIAGPTGGTPTKPVGTIFVGISSELGDRAIALKLSPMRSRDYLRMCTVGNALSAVLSEIFKIVKK